MEWLIAPFEVSFVQRALWGGLLVSCLCAIAGTWVVARGMAFLADAMAHGMLPGIAIAALLGGNLLVGAAFSAGAMALGVSALTRNARFSADIGIGLLFVGMLSIGVVIVSRAQSFAVDLTGFLFGDVLAIRDRDLGYLVLALLVAAAVALLGHRAFVALAFDPRTAHTLGLRPKVAQVALVGLLTLAIVASFHIVGTLLVFGLLIAPPAAAMFWAHRLPVIMGVAAGLGSLATVTGLLISWHLGTAAGATIAAVAVALFFLSATFSALRSRIRLSGRKFGPLAMVAVLPLVGCGADRVVDEAESAPHGFVEGAEETAEPQPRLVLADKESGAVRVLDLISEQVTELEPAAGVTRVADDGRYAYLSTPEGIRIIDTGTWLVDHGDHVHYYKAPIRDIGASAGGPVVAAAADPSVVALVLDSGDTALLDRTALDAGSAPDHNAHAGGPAVPSGEHTVVARRTDGRVEVRGRDGAVVAALAEPCQEPRGTAKTRIGVVFGCADGALAVNVQEGSATATKIAYPGPVPRAERAVEFHHRPGSTTLAAEAGERGTWLLDTRRKTWTFVETGPVLATNTAGEGAPLLTLSADGVLHAYDAATGTELTRKQLVEPGSASSIVVDSSRAYVNDPAGRKVLEIDYSDLRTARIFPLEIAPTLMVEAGE
ncbi:zinc ABC transporter permease AztB [Nocardia amikacinitolerans]|uniref:zinc ABC transporter permease AztB n=1 Tax=Nocardia amikacinitolerans TaxID=756689 RepID=UPI0020A3EB16|nr:zinc ABC transporter permease AztB [Nocardia amikacinitolerans]MCP2288604.1 ABC-type Mn2+/Zn2+ transport system, permease component [Nocardia amikacinitolerans]